MSECKNDGLVNNCSTLESHGPMNVVKISLPGAWVVQLVKRGTLGLAQVMLSGS